MAQHLFLIFLIAAMAEKIASYAPLTTPQPWTIQYQNQFPTTTQQHVQNQLHPTPQQQSQNQFQPTPQQHFQNQTLPRPQQQSQNQHWTQPQQHVQNQFQPTPQQQSQNQHWPLPQQHFQNQSQPRPQQQSQNQRWPQPQPQQHFQNQLQSRPQQHPQFQNQTQSRQQKGTYNHPSPPAQQNAQNHLQARPQQTYTQPLPRPLTEILSSNLLLQMADLVAGRPSAQPPTLSQDASQRSPFNSLAARQVIAMTDSQQVGGSGGGSKAKDGVGGSSDGSSADSKKKAKITSTPCARAIIICCKPNSDRVRYDCFEALGCPGFFAEMNPCSRTTIAQLTRLPQR